MATHSKFKVVEKSRTMVTYPMTDTEIKTIGAMSTIEQILMNVCSLLGGAAVGAFISYLSDKTNLHILTVTLVSGISFIVCLVVLVTVMIIVRKQKKGIIG